MIKLEGRTFQIMKHPEQERYYAIELGSDDTLGNYTMIWQGLMDFYKFLTEMVDENSNPCLKDGKYFEGFEPVGKITLKPEKKKAQGDESGMGIPVVCENNHTYYFNPSVAISEMGVCPKCETKFVRVTKGPGINLNQFSDDPPLWEVCNRMSDERFKKCWG